MADYLAVRRSLSGVVLIGFAIGVREAIVTAAPSWQAGAEEGGEEGGGGGCTHRSS